MGTLSCTVHRSHMRANDEGADVRTASIVRCAGAGGDTKLREPQRAARGSRALGQPLSASDGSRLTTLERTVWSAFSGDRRHLSGQQEAPAAPRAHVRAMATRALTASPIASCPSLPPLRAIAPRGASSLTLPHSAAVAWRVPQGSALDASGAPSARVERASDV